MGPHGPNEDGCELKRIHWSERTLSTSQGKDKGRRVGEEWSEEGPALVRFRYTGVEDLQNIVVAV